MIKWEGIFRDERSNDNYKVVITNTDGDVQVDIPSESLEYGVELPQGYYMAYVHLDRQDPFCSHMTDKAEIGTGYYVWFNVTKEREIIYFNAVDDTITLYDIGDPEVSDDNTRLDIDTLEQYQTIKLKGNTTYNIDGEIYDVKEEKWLYYCTENTQVQSIIQYKNFDTRELMLSGESPVVVNYEGADDDIFKPVKYSSCTIKLLTHWYDQDLFSRTATSNKVQLFWETDPEIHDWNLKWEGYLTPNLYNQGFAYDVEELELEALDNLAALKNIKYEGTKSVKPASKILHSFLNDKVDHIFVSDSFKVGSVVPPTGDLEGYTALEYLATDGTAYIDTGYYPINTTRVSTDISVNYENMGELPNSIYGAESDGKASIILSVGDYDNVHNVGYLTGTYCAGQSSAAYSESFATKRNVELGYKYTSDLERYASIRYDNIEHDFICYPLDRSDKTMYIFGYNTFWNSDHHPRGIVAGTAVGRFRIYEDHTLVMDLVPVKRNSDSMLGFYDVINDNFLTNAASSGAFIQGSPSSETTGKDLSDTEFEDPLSLNKLILSDYMFWDNDEAEWGYSNEILEEICKYLGMTAVLQGRTLWIIDYADKEQRFCIYDNRDNDFEMREQTITYRNNKDWGTSDYVDDDTQISMTSVYNQLKLQNDLSDFDNLTDDLFLRKNLTNLYGERYKVDEGSEFDNYNQNVVIWEREPLTSTNTTIYMWGDTSLSGNPITAMFQNPEDLIKEKGLPYWLDREQDTNLGLLCKCCSLYYKVHSKPQSEYHAQIKDSKDDYIMLTNRHMNQDHQKLIEFSLNSDNIVQSTKSYYVIDFGVIFSTAYYPCTDLAQKTTENVFQGVQEDDGKIGYRSLKIMCRMQYSDLYWNGSSWQQEECDFPIQLDADEDYVEALNTELKVNNMIDFKTGLDLQGYIVPIPMESSASVGSVKLSFPHYQYISPDVKATFISNLSINLTMKKKDKDEEDDSGEWEEVIDKSYVGDLELEESKYCTFDDTHLAYNTVGYLVDSDYYVLALFKYGDWIMKPEQIRLLKYGLQFGHPRKVIDVTLKHIWDNPSTTFTNWNMGDIKFVMSSWSHDYKSGNTTLKLIERR